MPAQGFDHLSSYHFDLPTELIAQVPVNPRDHSRLLIVDPETQKYEHRVFADILDFLNAGDVLVVNDTRVIPARLLGHRLLPDGVNGGQIEFLMLEELDPLVWEGMFRGSVKSKPGVELIFLENESESKTTQTLRATMLKGASESEHGLVVVKFDRDPLSLNIGKIPLPPYIDRNPEGPDHERYQTVYAQEAGSAAAPTAGLHFTQELLQKLVQKGVQIERVTLHIGLGTFRPVKATDLSQHQMHEERYHIEVGVAERLNLAKKQGRRIIAVGTTALRALESSVQIGEVKEGSGRTRLFLRPGQGKIKFVDSLITNFHLPQSTLLMLVCLFGGYELMMRAYKEAVTNRYRFFSYGDAMWIRSKDLNA